MTYLTLTFFNAPHPKYASGIPIHAAVWGYLEETTGVVGRLNDARTTISESKMRCLAFSFLLALSACGALPRDPDSTLSNIRQTNQFQVGLVSGTASGVEVKQLIGEVQRRTHAKPQIFSGSAEDLLQRLADGNVDLVVGSFAKNSPWQTEVAFGPPLRTSGPARNPIEVKAAMHNGENRWIMLVESASRKVSPAGSSQ